ncbi:SWI/SNF chromatin-remodeling complex subunit SNF5-like [Lucilia sericata]|uniref:SWI/SNF chromatin-remodeling complex subunit SNF5-like n=1 Tax=Lucilia sericata TaxID=13632 RepID=UPI0018A87668|nr:SWI/SNF chromatin-remodeling complex subunit SNF5-like [Lucilia sericata]
MDPAQNPELCVVCFAYHPLRYCKMFRKLTLEQRIYVVRTHKYCSNCFSRTHLIGSCISMGACQICCDLHHTLLHPRTAAQGPRQGQPQQLRQRARRSLPNPPQQRAQQRQRLRQRLQQQQQVIQQQQQQLQQQQRQQRQRQQLQQQSQRQPQRRQQQLPRPQQRQRQQLQPQAIAVPQPAAAPASTQGLVNQIVSALSQLTGSTIAPVQGGRHVEVRLGRVEDDLIDLHDDLIDFDDGLTDLD